MRPETWPPNILLPMLCIPEKETTSVDLCHALLSDIAQEYSKREARGLKDDIRTMNDLRSKLEHLAEVPSFKSRRHILLSYFSALCLIETLFSSSKGQINDLTFTWCDAFKNNKKASQRNIHLEKAAILFNVGAVYSRIGQSQNRCTNERRKEAVQAFCCAARVFAYLKDNVADEAAIGWSTTVDVSAECAGMLEKLMLAQAQECQFEIAIARGDTPEACAQVSRQVALDYQEALAAQNAEPLKGHVFRDWKSYMQLKAALFNAVACYGHALNLHEENRVAEEIARLTSGIKMLKRRGPLLLLFVSTEIKTTVKAIEELEAMMKTSLTKAEEGIGYRGSVPSPHSLPPLLPCSMVEQPPIEEVLIASNEKLFASLVHHSSAKALSRYAELAGGVIGTHKKKLKQCSNDDSTTLKKMGLSDFMLALEGHLTLPANLKEGVEAVQSSGGLAGLEAQLLELGKRRQESQELVAQTKEHLQTRRFKKINDKLKQAAETDTKIECSVKHHSALMSILDRRPIESALPIISLDANEDAIVGPLKNSLGQLKTLGAQGERLRKDLKQMYREDDIRPKLSALTSSQEGLFQEGLFKKEISKYDHTCKEIDQNIVARVQLLSQIQAQNDKLSSFPNLKKKKALCQKFYGEIEAAIDLYEEIKKNINQAKDFYATIRKKVKESAAAVRRQE